MARSSKDFDSASIRPAPAKQPVWTIATASALFAISLVLWIVLARSAGVGFFLLLYIVSAVAAVSGRSPARYAVIFTALLVSFVVASDPAAHAPAYAVMDIAALVTSGAGVVLLILWTGSDKEDVQP